MKDRTFIQLDHGNQKKADLIEEHSLISHQIINNLNEDAIFAYDHRCFAANTEILKELYADISKAFAKAYETSQHVQNKNKVFKMSFTAVDVVNGKDQ